MDMETAKAMLQLLLGKHWPLYTQFSQFLDQSKYKVINKDQWCNILEFSRTIYNDLSNYDVDGACEYFWLLCFQKILNHLLAWLEHFARLSNATQMSKFEYIKTRVYLFTYVVGTLSFFIISNFTQLTWLNWFTVTCIWKVYWKVRRLNSSKLKMLQRIVNCIIFLINKN